MMKTALAEAPEMMEDCLDEGDSLEEIRADYERRHVE